MENSPDNHEKLLTVGAQHAFDIHSLCNDVAATVFPSAISPATDHTIASVTNKLISLVREIEGKLLDGTNTLAGGTPSTWLLLARSGFLRETGLIDYVLARVAEDRLASRIADAAPLLATQLLGDANPSVVEAAQSLFAADSLHRGKTGQTYLAMRPELLHQLCWRVAAAIEVNNGHRDAKVPQNARLLLSTYDESQTARVAARKLSFVLNEGQQAALLDPSKAGLHLYIARIAHLLNIDHDHVLRLIDGQSIAPLSIMLRAVDRTAEQAMSDIYLFKSFSLTPREVALFERDYEALSPDVAAMEVGRWEKSRAQYLAFPQSVPVVQ